MDPPPGLLKPLYKTKSWSPDSDREEAWLRKKDIHMRRRKEARRGGGGGLERLSRSVTDEDLDELKACVELGFGFGNGSPGSAAAPIDHRLSDAFPALDLYYAVNGLSRSSSVAAIESDGGEGSSSPNSIISPGDSPEMVKERLKQWAQVVACSVRQFC
ncbi:hypothetical protein QJS04_geneDACA018566 [Acorus gramineus]|uniref:Uncharacterized protein n=1 Tax=Acorus gramineus TaxID=55184 RepID=A0AAV9AHB3_ACOGR|nr:hypothetical protein QJS04_geneDACA018566 [Acorus gramineus]